MSQLDPCLSFGFLLRSESDFTEFQQAVISAQSDEFALFHFIKRATNAADDTIGSVNSFFGSVKF